MDFLWRDALFALLLLPPLVFVYVRVLRRRKYALRYASLTLLKDAFVSSQRLRPHVPPLLFLCAIAALLLAAARPVTVMTLASGQRTVILAMDVSLSMAATDVAPSRLVAAQAAAKAFIRAQPRDVRIGIVAFAGEADMVLRPTTSRADAMQAVDALQLNYNTAIGSGILASLMTIFPEVEIGGQYDIFGSGRSPVLPQRVARNQKPAPRPKLAPVAPASFSSAAIVLLTDGRETIGIHHAKAAEMAAERGIRIYTVGFGTENSSMEMDGSPVDVGFDGQALKQVATLTRGNYFHASTGRELHDIYRTLDRQIVLERREREITALFAALGAVFSICAAGLSLAWTGRVV